MLTQVIAHLSAFYPHDQCQLLICSTVPPLDQYPEIKQFKKFLEIVDLSSMFSRVLNVSRIGDLALTTLDKSIRKEASDYWKCLEALHNR